MFNRRRRAASNPAPSRPPSASASLAASKAFLQDRQSNVALSSAAAAAALRTHPAPATQVGETVTKRMVRKASTSSHGSGNHGLQPPGLRRHSSSGSMTERSFRAPSPNRGSPVVDHPSNVPPVPAVPRIVPEQSVAHRRASSLEPSYRGGSPVGRGSGRGISVDTGAANTQGPGQRVISLSQVPEYEQDGSPRSINFSRPISPSTSPTPPIRPPSKAGGSGWFGAPVVNAEQGFRGDPISRPKTSDASRQYEAQSAWQSIQNVADRPVSTKKTQLSQGVEGGRFSVGSMRAKPTGTSVASRESWVSSEPVNPKDQDAVYDPSTRTFIRKQDAMARFRQLHEEEEPARHYVLHQAAPPKTQSQTQRSVSQRSPPPSRDVREPYFAPQPPRVEVVAQRHTERTPSIRTESVIEEQEEEHRFSSPPPVRQAPEDFVRGDVRPSADANTSRKLDSPVPDTTNEEPQSPTSLKTATNQDSAYSRVGTPVNQTPAEPQVGRGRGSIRQDRGQSMSPQRNAHFAAINLDVPNGVRHQPPPRSASPAKSALKSPSPESQSRRNSMPYSNNVRSYNIAPSEASDTVSEDGTRRKKKAVRVSFDEAPVIAGTSAYAESDVETPSSPSGLGQSRWRSTEDDHLDDVMRPRPALPSFGSVRDKSRRQNEADAPEKVTETVSSSMSTSVGSIREQPVEASSDHALGSIVAHDLAAKKQPTQLEPVPPDVTSVEGSGYYSDSDTSEPAQNGTTASEHPKVAEPEQPLPEPKTLTIPVENNLSSRAEVPVIAIQPASPSPSQTKYQLQRPHVPGGWDEEDFDSGETQQTRQPEPVAAPHSTVGSSLTWAPPPEPESSDDDDSIYSDAAEELTDNEDGGFASIDMIVESPLPSLMQSRFADADAVNLPSSSLQKEYTGALKQESAPASTDDWEATREHWVGLVNAHKEEQKDVAVTKAAQPLYIPATDYASPAPKAIQETTAPRKVEAKKTVLPSPVEPTQKPTQPRKSAMKKTTGIQPVPAPEPHIRKSKRNQGQQASASSDVHIRKSMRGSPAPEAPTSSDVHIRKSMRSSESYGIPAAAPGLAASRHSMPPVESRPPRGALQKKQQPANTVSKKPMAITPTYDSDSDVSQSSFQRERNRPRKAKGSSGAYSMRRSMRSDIAPTMRATPAMRPISPPTLVSSPPPSSLRKSMRAASPTPEVVNPTKSSRFSIRSLSPAGRFRATKAPKSKETAPPLPKASISSRFADSSDEEFDDRSKRFQSRFADSDDDDFDLPSELTPVRGIPRKPGNEDGDSTDLEDEDSDVELPAPKDIEKGRGGLANGNNKGGSFSPTSLQKSKYATELPTIDAGKKSKTKRGIFGLGKKKSTTTELRAPQTESNNPSTEIPMPPAHRDRSRDEQQRRPLTPIGEDDKAVEASPIQRPVKLQRRSTPQWARSNSGSWPLPETTPTKEEPRPQTADGVPVKRISFRPTLSPRNSAPGPAPTISAEGDKNPIVGRTGKKKKFQGLRRVFGLND